MVNQTLPQYAQLGITVFIIQRLVEGFEFVELFHVL